MSDDALFDADRYLTAPDRAKRTRTKHEKPEHTRIVTPDGPWRLIATKKKRPVAHYTYRATATEIVGDGESKRARQKRAEAQAALGTGAVPMLCGGLGAVLDTGDMSELEAIACEDCLKAMEQGKHFIYEGR